MGLRKRQSAPLPEVNLIPMLTVMMGVLAFFVVVTMTLTAEQGIDTRLPPNPEIAPPASLEDPPLPLRISLLPEGQILVNDEPLTAGQLMPQVRSYMAQSPEGVVVLTVAPQVPYAEVVTQLGQIQAVAGDRVALMIDEFYANPDF
jgi:biopolymer transport protein ExbD